MIYCLEDKIVQDALSRILNLIYDPLFLRCSHGFRLKHGCDTALVELDEHLKSWNCDALIKIDILKCFDTIPHRELGALPEAKIGDHKFRYLIMRLLKSSILNDEGVAEKNQVGCTARLNSVSNPSKRVATSCSRHVVCRFKCEGISRESKTRSLCGRCRVHLCLNTSGSSLL